MVQVTEIKIKINGISFGYLEEPSWNPDKKNPRLIYRKYNVCNVPCILLGRTKCSSRAYTWELTRQLNYFFIFIFIFSRFFLRGGRPKCSSRACTRATVDCSSARILFLFFNMFAGWGRIPDELTALHSTIFFYSLTFFMFEQFFLGGGRRSFPRERTLFILELN